MKLSRSSPHGLLLALLCTLGLALLAYPSLAISAQQHAAAAWSTGKAQGDVGTDSITGSFASQAAAQAPQGERTNSLPDAPAALDDASAWHATLHAGAALDSIVYVDASATGHDDGTSWADAYADLQDALAAAAPGDEIWVADGLYKPTSGLTRTLSFQLLSNVALYGGFVGTETLRTQRDWTAHLAVLSGDIDNNDVTDPNGVVVDPNNINGVNVYHVVNGSGVDATAVLDGFIVTAGYTERDNRRGGGMYNLGGSPQLANVTFSGNKSEFGGGLYNEAGRPTLSHVTFTSNFAWAEGGGMYK